jgi:hypothetical protein
MTARANHGWMDRQQGNEGLEKTTAGTCLLAFGFSALGFGSFFLLAGLLTFWACPGFFFFPFFGVRAQRRREGWMG